MTLAIVRFANIVFAALLTLVSAFLQRSGRKALVFQIVAAAFLIISGLIALALFAWASVYPTRAGK